MPSPAAGYARLAGLEPATGGLEIRCSIRLSYRRREWVGSGDRTHDTWNHNPVLYQLSYTHHRAQGHELRDVGVRGFEPPTPCSQSRCATRLRYTPIVVGKQTAGYGITEREVKQARPRVRPGTPTVGGSKGGTA